MPTYVQALYAYAPDPSTGADPNLELSFDAADIIEIIRKDESGWWEGLDTRTNRRGLFPQNYTKPYYGPPPVIQPVRNSTPMGMGMGKVPPSLPNNVTISPVRTSSPSAYQNNMPPMQLNQGGGYDNGMGYNSGAGGGYSAEQKFQNQNMGMPPMAGGMGMGMGMGMNNRSTPQPMGNNRGTPQPMGNANGGMGMGMGMPMGNGMGMPMGGGMGGGMGRGGMGMGMGNGGMGNGMPMGGGMGNGMGMGMGNGMGMGMGNGNDMGGGMGMGNGMGMGMGMGMGNGMGMPGNNTPMPPSVNKGGPGDVEKGNRGGGMGGGVEKRGGGGEKGGDKGGERGARGGAEKGGDRPARIPESQTWYGPWGSVVAMYCGMFYAIAGVGTLIWAVFGSAPPTSDRPWTINEGIVGSYAVVTGATVFIYEAFFDLAKTFNGTIPRRTYIYFFLPILGFAIPTLLTVLGGCFFTLPFLALLAAGLKKEYHNPKPEVASQVKEDEITCCRRIFEFVGGVNPNGRPGRIFFLILYIGANIAVGTFAFVSTYQANLAKMNAIPPQPAFTIWVCFAKFGGWVMDLNYSIILIPVAHSFIRYLYNLSTGDQTCFSKFWRAMLFVFPLDQALQVHKMCGIVGGIFALEHTVAHVINYGARPALVWSTYGITVWISGVSLLVIMLFMYPATHRSVKRGQFEIFWYTHMLFPVFLFFCIIHGMNTIGPNFWKFFIGPGSIYFVERIYRFKKEREPVCLVSATFMTNEVLILAIAKQGALANYKEGQYAFIACPNVSAFQWHPFTISSAPQEEHVTFHIRVQGPGSWTRGVVEYLRMLSGKGGKQAFAEFQRMDQATGRVLPGKYAGPDGTALLRVYGPNSAPTQHIGEYNCVMVCASGIGVTPLSSAMKSIAFFKWKYALGQAYPDQATFVWITSHKELRSFRWFIRTVKEVDDQIYDLRSKSPDNMRNKFFHFHFYLTSYQEGAEVDRDFDGYAEKYQNMTLTLEEDTEFWGQKLKESTNVQHESAPFDELQLYEALIRPGKGDVNMGSVTVHVGRPKWQEIFAQTAGRTTEKNIGVTFCGNPGVGDDLKKCCNQFTKKGDKVIKLHQEVF